MEQTVQDNTMKVSWWPGGRSGSAHADVEARQEVRRLLLKETSDVRGCQTARFLPSTMISEQETLLCRCGRTAGSLHLWAQLCGHSLGKWLEELRWQWEDSSGGVPQVGRNLRRCLNQRLLKAESALRSEQVLQGFLEPTGWRLRSALGDLLHHPARPGCGVKDALTRGVARSHDDAPRARRARAAVGFQRLQTGWGGVRRWWWW